MASMQEAVQRLTIEARAVGVDATTQSARQLDAAQTKLIGSSKELTTATGRQEQAFLKNQMAIAANDNQMRQLKAANDNVRGSFGTLVDGVDSAGGGIVKFIAGVLDTINHLKLLALVAYAASPALRGFVNTEIVSGFALLRQTLPGVATAAASVLSFLSPMLTFFARIAAPIAAVVLAWKALNYIWDQGVTLLEKYGNASRAFFAPDVDANLKKLTTLQPNDQLSAQQVAYATQLADRLAEAKKTISDFLAVNIDVTNMALRLQNAWVFIVERIAAALSAIKELPGAMSGWLTQLASVIPFFNLIRGVAAGLGALSAPITGGATTDDMAAARARLSAGLANRSTEGGLGNTFGARFTDDIRALTGGQEKKAADDARDAWDRATASIEKHILTLKAETLTIGQGAGATEGLRAEFQLLEAAKNSDRNITEDQIQKYTELRGSMSAQQALSQAGIKLKADEAEAFNRVTQAVSEAAAAYAKAKVASDISFGRQTALLSPEDVQIAQQLRTLYGNDVPAALSSTEAAALRVNDTFKEFGSFLNTATSQITTGLADIFDGTKSVGQGFSDMARTVLRSLEEMVIKILIVQPLINALRQALNGIGGVGGLFGGLFGGGGAAEGVGGTFGGTAGGLLPLHHTGGIVGSEPSGLRYIHPAYFDYAPRFHAGGIAGDEVPIIARRGEGVFTPGQMKAMGGGATINLSTTVNVQGGATKADHEQAAMISQQVTREMESLVDRRIIHQMRPGGVLN